jgi:hypothetical protein
MWILPAVLILSLLPCITGCGTAVNQASGDGQPYIDDFEYLSAYGAWVVYEPYGDVWLPDVVAGWAPFYYGHWMWTADGWSWTSYEPYGWLVYHYGSWGHQPGLGWFWVPDDIWSPARVQWYTFGDYASWAPLPPPGLVWADPWELYEVDPWIVVGVDNFTNENIGDYKSRKPVSAETAAQRNFVRRAPDVKQVERASERTVPTVRIREQDTNVQPRSDSKTKEKARQDEPVLKRMVLPRAEKRKVEKHTSEVEREVLAPDKKVLEPKKKTSGNETDPKRKSR